MSNYLGMVNNINLDITVSVCMITYNHEAFIAQAIEGVLMQQTDFSFELVIGEDCSTDSTRAIVQDYAKRYPKQIRLLLPEQNLGMIRNFMSTVSTCQGKYVALCEGDDYWTDSLKLQKQVDYLESNSGYALCFHDAMRAFQPTGAIEVQNQRWVKAFYTVEDIIKIKVSIPTSTIMYPRGLILNLPSWFIDLPLYDTALFILIAQHGKIGLINQIMSVTRIHDGGVWQGSDEIFRQRMVYTMWTVLKDQLGDQYQKLINKQISGNQLLLASLCAEAGDITDAKNYIVNSVSITFLLEGKWVDQLVMLMRLYLPWLYRIIKLILRKE